MTKHTPPLPSEAGDETYARLAAAHRAAHDHICHRMGGLQTVGLAHIELVGLMAAVGCYLSTKVPLGARQTVLSRLHDILDEAASGAATAPPSTTSKH